MRRLVQTVSVALVGLLLLFFAYHWTEESESHCATGNWVSSDGNRTFEILNDRIAVLDRLTTSSGWKDTCGWHSRDKKTIILECKILGSENKSAYVFRCGNTNKIGYVANGIESGSESLVMYRSE